MFQLLRRIDFPEDLNTSGPVIKATMIRHVKTHLDLVQQARQKARNLLDEAAAEADVIRERVRHETAQSVRHDLKALKQLVRQNDQQQHAAAGQLCTEICKTILLQVLGEIPEFLKLRMLAESLLSRAQNARELLIHCHPGQADMVREQVAGLMADQLHMKRWVVEGNPELPPYTIRIATPNGSEIRVSLDNLLALYNDEIDALGGEIQHALSQKVSHEMSL